MRHVRMGVRMLRVTVALMGRRQRTRTRLRVAPVLGRPPQPQVALLQVRVMPLAAQRVRVSVRVRRTVHHLSYFRVLVADVVRQLGLLESGGGHPLVPGSGTGRRVRRVQARLDEGLPGLAGYHRLELARREGVDVAGLGRHQQHHLGAGQRRQLVRLEQGERCVQ